VVAHDELLDAAEELAGRIMRNDPWAVRSAKETILNVIGRPLDDQLAYEAITGYSGAANPAVRERLEEFYERTDPDRPGGQDPDPPGG
jgi:enoyl-CoA hydratase/carnithine racemase